MRLEGSAAGKGDEGTRGLLQTQIFSDDINRVLAQEMKLDGLISRPMIIPPTIRASYTLTHLSHHLSPSSLCYKQFFYLIAAP